MIDIFASNLSPLSPVTVGLINVIGLLIVVTVAIRNTFQDRLTSVFVIMSALMFTWIDFAYAARFVGSDNLFLAELFLRIAWVATPPFFAYVYLITVHLLRKEKQFYWLNITLLALAVILSAATAFTDYIIKSIGFSGPNLDIIYGEGLYPFLGIISLYIVATLFPIFVTRLEDYRKKRVRIFLAGILLFYVANLIFNITLPIFFGITHLYYFGDYSLVFLVGFTAYAIVRHRLLDIKTVIFRAVIFAVLTSLFFVAYGVATYWVTKYLEDYGSPPFLYAVFGTIGIALAIPGYRYFRTFLRQITDQFLFQNKVNYQKALVVLGEELSTTIKIEEVTRAIIQAMDEIVRVRKVVILLHDSQRDVFAPGAQAGVRNFRASIPQDDPLLQHLKHDQRIVAKDELKLLKEQESSPSHMKEIGVIENALIWLDMSVVIPLFVNRELTGLILLGDKLSGEPYQQADLNFLSALAPQAATALENARLYQESLEFGARLKQEVQRATHDLEVANRQLRDLDKAKSEFLSIASHQLYTPLTAIRGYLSMLREGDFGKLEKQQAPVIDVINKSAERLIELIKNLLDISRIESGRLELNLEETSLVEMAKEIAQDLMPNAMTKNLKLEFHEPEQPIPNVIADKERLRQVVLNFVDNAIKYTDTGHINVSVAQEGSEVVLHVKDTGKGLDQHEISKLFTKFTRAGDASHYHTEGTGLGLYVARQIIREHRGEVEVTSPGKGKGSTFSMRMPAAGTPHSLKLGDKATVVIKAAEATGAIAPDKVKA